MQRLADLVNNAAIRMVLSIIALVVGVETFLGKKNTEFVSTNIFSYSLSLSVGSFTSAKQRGQKSRDLHAEQSNKEVFSCSGLTFQPTIMAKSKRCEFYHHYSNIIFLNV